MPSWRPTHPGPQAPLATVKQRTWVTELQRWIQKWSENGLDKSSWKLKIYKYWTTHYLYVHLCLQEENLNICILISHTYFWLCSLHENICCRFLTHIYSSTCCTNVLFSAAGLLLTASRLYINILVFVQVVIICKFLILLQKSLVLQHGVEWMHYG